MKELQKGGNVEVQECMLPERDCLLSHKLWKEAEGIQKLGNIRLWVVFSEVSKSRKINPVNITIEIMCIVYKIRNTGVIFLNCMGWMVKLPCRGKSLIYCM